jgi:hypothetical protein
MRQAKADRPASIWDIEEGERERMLWHLARRLYETLERLDPSLDALPWDALPDFDRVLYRSCAAELVEATDYWRKSLIPATTA